MRFTIVQTRQNQQRDTTTWGVVDARDDDTSHPVVVKSSFWPLPSFGCVFRGMSFDAGGRTEHHAEYGPQFVASSLTCLNTQYAATVSALLMKFHARPKWILRVLEVCGMDLRARLDNVERGDAPIDSIGLRNGGADTGYAEKLMDAYRDTKVAIDLCTEFPTLPVKVAMELKTLDAAQIEQNPWVIAERHKINRESMLSIADRIGIRKMGRNVNDPARLEAYARAAFTELSEYASFQSDDAAGHFNDHQGSTWFSREVFVNHMERLLLENGVNGGVDVGCLFEPETMPLYLKCDEGGGAPMFTLSKVDFVERSLASALVARRCGADARATAALSAFDGLLAPSGGDEERRQHEERLRELSPRWRDIFEIYRALDDQQRGCLRTLVWHRKVLLVGAAGTGKTLTLSCCIRFLVDILNEETRALALMGKAAARIHQTLNDERIKCSTVHAELARMSREPLSYAIDEVGTCPTALLQRLVVDLPTDRYLIFSGDEKQLPSIQPGSLLTDMLRPATDRLPVVRLTTIHRNADGSQIAQLSPSIFASGAGQFPAQERCGELAVELIHNAGRAGSNQDSAQLRRAVAVFREYQTKAAAAGGGAVQVLTNTNSVAEQANRLLQPLVLPQVLDGTTPRLERKCGAPFVLKDRVVCTETVDGDDARIYNGTLGTICVVDGGKKTFVVQFDDGNKYTYSAGTFGVKHSYCMTVHRSQGSEYQYVVVLLPSLWALSKNLLYTAITRAQKEVTVIISEFHLKRGLCVEIDRTTRLGARIAEEAASEVCDQASAKRPCLSTRDH